jgi:biotin synthase
MSSVQPLEAADRILSGAEDTVDPATLVSWLSGEADVWDLMNAADRVRRARFGNRVHLCSIINAKEGGCPEDCGFCSQSKHFTTHVTPSRFTPVAEIVAASETAGRRGASALGLVTATRGMEVGTKALDRVLEGVRAVRSAGHTEAHASVGILDDDAVDALVSAGLTELNHNLETGRSYFEQIVSTHTYDERIATIRRAKAKGLRTCVGGIFGMGESPAHRAELAQTLRELEVDEVPLNFLVSIEGTALAHVEPLAPMEILRIISAFRLFLPRPNIFIAAGRMHLGQLVPLMFQAGASGMMVGDFLTTPNRSVDDDLRMIDELGLVPLSCGEDRPERRAQPEAAPAIERSAPPPRPRLPVLA